MRRARKHEFGIRKLSVGVCSVAIGMSVLATSQVLAEETPASAVENESTEVRTEPTAEPLAVAASESTPPAAGEDSATEETVPLTDEIPPAIDYEALPQDSTGFEFADAEVEKAENVTLTADNGSKIVFTDEVKNHLTTADSGTIYVEYKAPSNAPFHTIFNATSSSHDNNYTIIYASGTTLAVETRTREGYRHLNQGTQTIKNGEWNAVALTYDKNPDTNQTTVRLYSNGVLSFETTDNKHLFSTIPNLAHVQLGAAQRKNGVKWAVNDILVRNATVYNRALTEEEIKYRSALFEREAYVTPIREGELVTEKLAVFEGGSGNRKNAQNVFSYRIPALLKTADGTLIAAVDERNTTSSDWGDIATVIKRSTDNGETWSDTIKIVDLKNSPDGPGQVDPFTIDPVLVQDPQSKRIFAFYDMMPDHVATSGLGGAMGVSETPVTPYSEINGKKYLNLFKDDQTYTVRENGVVYDSAGQATVYRVNIGDAGTHFANLGDLYENDQVVGNIYFQHATGDKAFKVAKTMYIWLSHSDDDGVTWSRPRDLTAGFIQPHMKFLGMGPGAGIVLRTGDKAGRLVVPGYVANYTTGFNGSQSAFVFYSDDHGESWQMGKTFNDNRTLSDGTVLHSSSMNNSAEEGTEATVVQLNNGDLKMFMRGRRGKVRVATSKNGGESWENTVETMEDVPDVYVQLSAVHLNREGKEYVVLANASGPGRTNGHVRLAEVQTDGSLNWINHRQIEPGKFAYNSLQYLGNDEFGLLYEHSSGSQNDYTAYYKKFNWTFLTLPEPKLPENPLLTVQIDQEQYAILTFEKPILATASPSLLLSNGRTIPFVAQLTDKHLVYRITEEDKGAAILDVASGDLSNINGFKTILGQFISDTDPRKITKLDSKQLRVSAEDVWQGGKGPDNLLDGDKNSVTELLWDVDANRVDGKLPDRIRLPQVLTFSQRSRDPFNLHTLIISKRTPGNGTMTKYQIKGYLGEELVHDSGEKDAAFTEAEITHSFGDGIRVDRLEVIPLEARINPTTVANQMLTLKEVAFYAVDTLREVRRKEVEETLYYTTERVDDPNLLEGTEEVGTEGQDGRVTKLYDIVLINGVISESTLVGEKEGSRVAPVAKVIRVGRLKKVAGSFVKALIEEDQAVYFQNGKGVTFEDTSVEFQNAAEAVIQEDLPVFTGSLSALLPISKPVAAATELAAGVNTVTSQHSPLAKEEVTVVSQQETPHTSATTSERRLPSTGDSEKGYLFALGLVGLLVAAKRKKSYR